MTYRCPECGGLYDEADGCATQFGLMLEREFVDPAYGIVHHLTVAGYMLQHATRLSRRGWLEMRALLRKHLREGVDVEGLKRHIRAAGVTSFKGWSFKPDGTRMDEAIGFAWSQTIATIDLSSGERYGDDVRRWADSVLAEAESIGD